MEILDKAKLMLAPTLQGCALRRFDLPSYGFMPTVDLCFSGEEEPIVPMLMFNVDKYFSSSGASIYYSLMLEDYSRRILYFRGINIPVALRLDSGPEVIAKEVGEALSKLDLSEVVAAGSIERILTEYGRSNWVGERNLPWTNFHLALCAAYLGRDQDAQMLLQDSLRLAREDKHLGYVDLIRQAEGHLAKLESNADSLRNELTAMMDWNWSHFKIVGTQPTGG